MTQKSDTRDKKSLILAATARLLSTKGIQACGFENIAEEAGLSRQLIRYYYADLDALMADLCDHLAGTYRDILVTGIPELGDVNRLDFFLDFFFGISQDYPMPDHLEAYDAMVAYSVAAPALKQRMCDQYKILGQVIAHELAIMHPQLKGSACDELSFLFVSAMHAHWSFVASLGHSRDHGHLARHAFSAVIASYLARAPSPPVIERPWSKTAEER